MRLPEDLTFRNSAHGHGDRGMAFYTYEDTAGAGVVMQARRENGRARFVQTWRFAWLPEREFATLAALAAALEPLTDADIAAEKARWPRLGKVIDISGKDWPNKCLRHRRRPGLVQAYVDVCWIPSKGLIASPCAECRGAATGNGRGVVDIMEERRRHVAATKPPLQMLLEGGKP